MATAKKVSKNKASLSKAKARDAAAKARAKSNKAAVAWAAADAAFARAVEATEETEATEAGASYADAAAAAVAARATANAAWADSARAGAEANTLAAKKASIRSKALAAVKKLAKTSESEPRSNKVAVRSGYASLFRSRLTDEPDDRVRRIKRWQEAHSFQVPSLIYAVKHESIFGKGVNKVALRKILRDEEKAEAFADNLAERYGIKRSSAYRIMGNIVNRKK